VYIRISRGLIPASKKLDVDICFKNLTKFEDRRFSAHSKVYFGAVTDSPEVSLIRRINTVKYI